MTATLLLAAALTPGFTSFFNFEFDEAIRHFERQVAASPDSSEAHNHLARAILYREMLENGALEAELVSRQYPGQRKGPEPATSADQRTFDEHISHAVTLANKRLQSAANDPQALYQLGVSYSLRAKFNYLIRRAWTDALKDASEARKLHDRVLKLQPGNIDARLVPGVHDYLVGSLPWHYKVLGLVAGIRGDRDGGIRAVEQVAAKGDEARHEAQMLLAAIYRREQAAERSLPLLTSLVEQFPRNPLFRLELAMMLQDLGQNDRAITIIDEVERQRRRRAARWLPVEKLAYYKGHVYFWCDQWDRALAEYKRALANPNALGPDTTVLTWMRIGQIHDVKGDRASAAIAYRNAVRLAPGSNVGEEAKSYLSAPFRPRPRR